MNFEMIQLMNKAKQEEELKARAAAEQAALKEVESDYLSFLDQGDRHAGRTGDHCGGLCVGVKHAF